MHTLRIPSITALAALAACSATSESATRTTMPSELHKQIVRRLYEDCINPGRLDLLPELVSDDFVGPRGERGPTGFAGTVTGLRTGFPDIRFTLDDVIGDGDRVAVRWTWQGTHQGPFGGHAPTGKRLHNSGIAIYQLADRKIVRTWLETDRLGALQQMGIIDPGVGRPAPPSAPPR